MDLAKLMARVQRLLMSPAAEWDAIAGEPADIRAIYMNHVGPLVIAAALALVIGMSFIAGIGGMRLVFAYTLTYAISWAVLQLLIVYGAAYLVNALAPQFGATSDLGQAFKLVAYSSTAFWVAALAMIVPMLNVVLILGALYAIYLLYVGLPKLMKPPEDKLLIYTLAIVGVMIVLNFVAYGLAGAMLPSVTPMMGR